MKKEVLAFLLSTSGLMADLCDDYYVNWFGLGHREGEGVGYRQGYTTFSTFLVAQKDFFSFCPFFDLRVHVFNQGKPAGNFGIGGRTFLNQWDGIAGVNLFYDFRKTEHRMAHQIGFGFEWLGTSFDFFANGYVPIGPLRSHFFDTQINGTKAPQFLEFSGHNIIIGPLTTRISSKRQYEFGGFDAFFRKTLYDTGVVEFSAEIGPYFYFGEYKKDIYGGSFRLSANVLEYVIVGGEVNYDSLFRTTANGFIGIQIPFGCRKAEIRNPCSTCDILQSKLARRVDRREIIPVKVEKKVVTLVTPPQVALNTSGQPIDLVFVNNTNPSSGDGTFEDPYNQLLSAEGGSSPGDIIYVSQGDGTTNGMSEGFVLQDNQEMYGSGNGFTLQSLQGPIFVPARTPGAPQITNTLGGNTLTLANNNVVNGFWIFNPSTNGIFGNNIENGTISNNTISNYGAGILLMDSGGSFLITSNTLSSSNPTPIVADEGIYFNDTNGQMATVHISNNTVTGYYGGIRSFGLNGSMVTATIENNTVSNALDIGIDVSLFDDSFGDTQVVNNVVNGTPINGIIVFTGTGSFQEGAIIGNQVFNCTGSGILTGTGNGGFLSVDVQSNLLTGNANPGFKAETSISPPGGDVLCLRLNYNESDTGFEVHNLGATTTLYLEPPLDNVGTLTELGIITPVSEGYCTD